MRIIGILRPPLVAIDVGTATTQQASGCYGAV